MTKKQMKQSLQNAVLTATPYVLDKVLAQEDDSAVVEFRETSPPKQNMAFKMATCAIAAVFMLCIGIFYAIQPKVDSLVSIDVNPGIELYLDAADRVLDCKALNSDAVKVLDGMDLKQKPVNTATDEIVHSLIRYGYLAANSDDNAILISVANGNTQKVEGLQKKIVVSVNTVLKQNNAKAVVLQQNENLTKDLKSFAEENQISFGKANFVQKIAERDSSLETQALASLSIKELALLVDENQIDVSDVVTEYQEDSKVDESIETLDSGESSHGNVSPDGAGHTKSEHSSSSSSQASSHESSENSKTGVSEQPPQQFPQQPPVLSEPVPSEEETKPVNGHETSVDDQSEPADDPTSVDNGETKPVDDPTSPIKDSGTVKPVASSGKSKNSESSVHKDDSVPPSKVSDDTLVDSSLSSSNNSKIGSDIYDCPVVQDSGIYCEYCGKLNMLCKGRCSHFRGKRYCKYCGRLKEVCHGSCMNKDAETKGKDTLSSKQSDVVSDQGSHEAAKN
jgi:hypothetical protein